MIPRKKMAALKTAAKLNIGSSVHSRQYWPSKHALSPYSPCQFRLVSLIEEKVELKASTEIETDENNNENIETNNSNLKNYSEDDKLNELDENKSNKPDSILLLVILTF